MATSQLDGIGPASLKVLTRSSCSARVPFDFQFPPIKYLRSPSGAGTEDPFGRALLDEDDRLRVKYTREAPTAAAMVAIAKVVLLLQG